MSDFGLKIGVEGEKDFKNSFREINQSFKVLGSEMKLVSSQFDKNDKSIGAVTARNETLNKSIDAQKDKIDTLQKALANATDSFGENDRRTQAWAIQLNNAKAELNGMERELKQNEKALDNVADEFDNAEKQADDFEDEIKKASNTADNAGGKFSKLSGILKGVGAAMGATFVAVGTATVGVAKALTDMTVGAAAYADEIITMASVTGMSTESLQSYKYAADLVDVSMETLTGSMSKQIKSMASARDGNTKMQDAYTQLGVAVANTDGTLRNSDDVYWETIDALAKMSEGAERDALSMQIFGKSAQELNPLIAQGSEGIKALTDEAKQMGAVMSDGQLMSLGEFDDSVQRLKAGSDSAKNAIGMILLPQLQSLADDGTSLLGNFTRGLNEAGGDFSKISDVIGTTIGGIADMILSNIPQIIDVAMNIVTSIGSAILDNLPMLVDTATQIIFTLLQGLITALPQITQGALQLVLALVDGIIQNLPSLVEAALTMIITLATGLADALPKLIPSIIEAIILVVETLLNNMDKILDAAFKIIEGLAQGLLNALPKLIEALPKIIESIINFITSNLPKIIEMGIKLVVQLAVGLVKAIPQLVASIPQIITALLGGLGQAVVSATEIGGDIVKGLWEGIKSLGGWIGEKVSGFFTGIVDGAKNLLGIHSPSTVFDGIGSNMGEGIGVGFEKAMRGVEKDMMNAIPVPNIQSNAVFDMSTNASSPKPQSTSSPFVLSIENFYNNRKQDIEELAYELEFYRQRVAYSKGTF